jgi:SAM-dependent methyltransferase
MSYTLFGRSIYRAFDDALRRCTGQGFGAARQIVDWGCGSARVSRHIVPSLGAGQQLIGFDIDGPAVDWSNRHIGPYYRTCELNPPLRLDGASTDVAFAYSVFTHLSERSFHDWLAEMRRILVPGGTVLFTILSDFAMAALSPGFPRSAHAAWIKRGIYDDSGNAQLETIGVGGAVYRNTWVKRAFVKDALARAGLELVEIESPMHFYQDLVVARRPL